MALPDAPSEEALAAVAAGGPVVLARGLVPADGAVGAERGLLRARTVGLGEHRAARFCGSEGLHQPNTGSHAESRSPQRRLHSGTLQELISGYNYLHTVFVQCLESFSFFFVSIAKAIYNVCTIISQTSVQFSWI